MDGQTDRRTGRQTDRQTDRDRWIDRQIDRQTDKSSLRVKRKKGGYKIEESTVTTPRPYCLLQVLAVRASLLCWWFTCRGSSQGGETGQFSCRSSREWRQWFGAHTITNLLGAVLRDGVVQVPRKWHTSWESGSQWPRL